MDRICCKSQIENDSRRSLLGHFWLDHPRRNRAHQTNSSPFRNFLQRLQLFQKIGPWRSDLSHRLKTLPNGLQSHVVGFAAEVGKAVAAIQTQIIMPIQRGLVSGGKGQQGLFLMACAFPTVGGTIT